MMKTEQQERIILTSVDGKQRHIVEHVNVQQAGEKQFLLKTGLFVFPGGKTLSASQVKALAEKSKLKFKHDPRFLINVREKGDKLLPVKETNKFGSFTLKG